MIFCGPVASSRVLQHNIAYYYDVMMMSKYYKPKGKTIMYCGGGGGMDIFFPFFLKILISEIILYFCYLE